MLIECPEERHDSWHKKWESYSKFKLSNPITPQSVPVVLIMEDMQNDYTVLQLIEALTEQIPFLSNHIYFTPADEHDTSVAVKLKLFQSYDYVNPYHQPPYINPKNPFHELAEQTEPPLQVSPGQTVQLVTDADGNPSLAVVGADNTNNETSPSGDPNADIQKDDSSNGSDNGSDNSNKSTFDSTKNAPSTDSSPNFDGSLFSLSQERNVNADNTKETTSNRQRRKHQYLENLISKTCKQEMYSFKTDIVK